MTPIGAPEPAGIRVGPAFPRRRDGFYYLDGQRYPSVTTILSVLSKPALIHWAARTAAALVLADPDTFDTAQKAAGGIYTARDRAADRGSLIHSFAEALSRGGAIDVDGLPEEVRGYGRAFLSWVAQVRPSPLFTESNVFNLTHGYAGTFDLLCALPSGQLVLVDLKTTRQVYEEASPARRLPARRSDRPPHRSRAAHPDAARG